MNPPPLAAAHPWKTLTPDGRLVRRLASELGMEPMLAGILANRGITDRDAADAFLKPSVDALHDAHGLADMQRAAERVTQALAADETILIYGDADVDGLSATALLVEVLSTLGRRPLVFVPNRAYDGYSFTERGVQYILEQGAKLVISVDNGTSAVDAIAELQGQGVDVIVTDHHLPAATLPPAFALVNPRREDCHYPNPELSGTGVAFKLACAVAHRAGGRGRAPAAVGKVLGGALAWVAMGTVADVMPLVGENRVLVARGLRALTHSASPGLRALCGVSGMGPGHSATTEDISFKLAPRINAAARMGRSDVAVALVTATDENIANDLAATLDKLNRDRQAAERRLMADLAPRLAEVPDGQPAILGHDDWNTGLLGLVAGRVSRQRGIPTVLVSWAQGNPGKGSCRSAGSFHVHAALEHCAPLLAGFGGHRFAAGFSLARENMDAFRAAFLENWEAYAAAGRPTEALNIEGELPLVALNTRFLRAVEQLEPFGQANHRPLLVSSDVEVAVARRMGGDGSHLELQLAQGVARLRAVAFGRGDLADQLVPGQHIDVVYHPKLNRWRGREQPEAELVDLRSARSGASAPGDASAAE
ncbi:MAG: single-stranded-DNA-specific exonuclease RecJ [Planctomycetota bacterium]|nr:MAG: single-stranded-DNA-specific exonuclease RecJ [Planctomycetota bacterium]